MGWPVCWLICDEELVARLPDICRRVYFDAERDEGGCTLTKRGASVRLDISPKAGGEAVVCLSGVYGFNLLKWSLTKDLESIVHTVLLSHGAKPHGPPAPKPSGLCPACGYDLRATPEGGGPLLARCPECGAVPAPS